MSLKNSSLDQVRLNVNNGQTYTLTVAMPFATLGNAVMQGFASSAGDGGKATFTSNLTSAANFTQGGNIKGVFIDLIFANTGASNANHLFTITNGGGSDCEFISCVFHGARGSGFLSNGNGNTILIECEAYDNNKSNTAACSGFSATGSTSGMIFCYNCYSHDNTAGTNAHGFTAASNAQSLVLINCIAESNAGNGVSLTGNAPGALVCIGCNMYNNTGDGVKLAPTGVSNWLFLMNNNFIKNTGSGVNNTFASQGGILYNNGRGAGTQANGAVDVLQSIVNTSTDITYASNVTPWNAPTTGDFTTLRSSTAFGAGRGVFVETDGTNTGTLSYPDIGASQAVVAGSGGLRLAGSGGLAA